MATDLFQAPDYYKMDDLLNEEHKMVRDAARDWVKKCISPIIEDEELKLEWSMPQELPVVFVDPKLIRQIFVNLVDNAIKYTERGNVISVSAKIDDNMVQCVVNDNGVGIPKADIPRVFERFYRVDKARNRSVSGTGLGLSICKHICLQHGGAVWVESEVGKGSSFYFTLPIYRPEIHDSSAVS